MNRSDAAPALAPLTEREAEILRLIAEGFSNAEIARKLYLTLGTVKWYNTQIYDKLGVKSRTQATIRARDLGLLDSGLGLPPAFIQHNGLGHNLPASALPFIGRERELAAIVDLLSEPATRLLTVVGPGGMGKTRLGIEVAEQLLPNFPDGAYFISLAPLSSPEDIRLTIASTLDIALHNDPDSRHQLVHYLRPKTMLLVMDNFDSLLDGAGLVSDILRSAPGVKVLVTSRERLNLQEETVYRLEGLGLPATDADAASSSAVQLFLSRASAVRPGYAPAPDELADIVRICRMVEGMPLGIVLAAAWVEVLSPAEIAQEINRSLDFLQTEMRDVPERHRSMRVVFDSTWNMLTADEKYTFGRLSVFRGGFTREAAEQVTNTNLWTLMALMNKSLLHRHPDGRFEIHELLRQYAAEYLKQLEGAFATYEAHSRYYLEFLYNYPALVREGGQSDTLNQIEADIDNLRAAWNWAVDQRHYDWIDRALDGLYLFCYRRSRLEDGLKFFDRAIQSAEQPAAIESLKDSLDFFDRAIQAVEQSPDTVDQRVVLRLLEYRGKARGLMGVSQFEDAVTDLNRVLAAVRSSGDKAWKQELLVNLGQLYRKTERYNQAIGHLREGLKLARASGDRRAVANTLYHLGTVSWSEGDNIQAAAYHQEAAELCRSLGLNDLVAVQAFHGLGEAMLVAGQPQAAVHNFLQSLELARQIGDISYESENMQMAAWTCMGMVGIGDYRQALEFFPSALEISRAAHLDWHRTCTHIGYGLAQGAVGNYGEGLANLEQGYELAESVGLSRLRSMALDALGQHYQDLNLPEKAEIVHTQGIHLMLQTESTFWLPRLQANRAIDRLRQGDLSVRGDLLEALDITSKRGQEFHAVRCLEGLAELSMAQARYHTAISYADQLRALAEPRDMREMLAQAHRWRGEALFALGDIEGAEVELSRALQLANWVGRVRLLWDVRRALAACRRAIGDSEAAVRHESDASDILTRITNGLPDARMRIGLPMLHAS